MKKYRLLFLDFDGVISDSLKICMEEINRLVRTEFPTIPEVCSQEDMVVVYSVKLRYSLYRFGLDDIQTKKFFDKHSQAMNLRAKEVEPFYEVIGGLTICNIPKVIVTSSYSNAVYTIFRKCKEFKDDFVQKVYGRECNKTKTEKIRNAIELFSVDTSDALFIGDLVSDILYCRDIPLDIACVGYGYHPSSYLQKFLPTYILETVDEFLDFLLVLGKNFNVNNNKKGEKT